ncbi:MAG: hypothetical protein K1X86_00365 [Ignavibacteria bacterium]|nr:hypothetical protein [Ignavibacteria bacterium]
MKKINYLLTLLFFIPSILFGQENRTLLGHSGSINCLSFSPDGKTLMSGGSDEKIIFWDVETGKNSNSISTSSNCTSVNYSKDGKYIVYTTLDKGAFLYEVESKKTINILELKDCFSASISNDNKYICVTGMYRTTTTVYNDYSKKNEQQKIIRFVAVLYSIESKSRVKDFQLSEALDHEVKVSFISVDKSYRSYFFNSCFTVNSKYLIFANPNGTISPYSFDKSGFINNFTGHNDQVFYVVVSPDGNFLASGSKDETAKVWNISTGKSIKTFKDHSDDVNAVCFSPDSKYVVTASDDKTVKVWDINSIKLIKTLTGFNNDVISVAFSPDGRYIAAGGKDNKIIIWNTEKILPDLKLFTTEFDVTVGINSRIEQERKLELEKIQDLYRPKGEFETQAEYQARIDDANLKKNEIEELFKKKAEDLKFSKQQEVNELKNVKEQELNNKIQNSIRDTVIKIDNISSYNADNQSYNITIRGKTESIIMPREDAINFKKNWAKAVVKCKKRLISNGVSYEYYNIIIVDPDTKKEYVFGKQE